MMHHLLLAGGKSTQSACILLEMAQQLRLAPGNSAQSHLI
jgi:hypothetical protein